MIPSSSCTISAEELIDRKTRQLDANKNRIKLGPANKAWADKQAGQVIRLVINFAIYRFGQVTAKFLLRSHGSDYT